MSAGIQSSFIEVMTLNEALKVVVTKTRLASQLGVHRNTVGNMGDNFKLAVLRDNSMIVGFELINKGG